MLSAPPRSESLSSGPVFGIESKDYEGSTRGIGSSMSERGIPFNLPDNQDFDSPREPEASCSDTTMLLDIPDKLSKKPWLGDQQTHEKFEHPVLSLVSLNPKTASSVDLLRGHLKVLKELPDPSPVVRTVRVSCGRDLTNSIVTKDSRVSLKHFTLTIRAATGGRVAMEVMDHSNNGTWVDGRRVGKGCSVPLLLGGRIVPLPAAVVGRDAEIAYVLVYDTKGARCRAGLSLAAELPVRDDMVKASMPQDLEQDLCCGICTDVLHRCLTVIPCGHNFCATCLAKWWKRSSLCPGCRAPVTRAVQNPDVDRMAEAFLHAHPESARGPEELAALDRAARDAESASAIRWLLRDTGELSRHDASAAFIQNVATPQRNAAQRAGIGRQEQETPQQSSTTRHHSVACVVS